MEKITRDKTTSIEIKDAVTSVLSFNGKILILHRSSKVGTYKGFWAGVSGHLEKGDRPEDRALIEIAEETKLDISQVKIIKKGKIVYTPGETEVIWRIHPFLVESTTDKVQIDWEHTEYKWISPSEIDKFKTVPNYKRVVKDLLRGYNIKHS